MIELDEFGHAMWIHKEIPNIVLDRSYRWFILNGVCNIFVLKNVNRNI